MGDIVASHDRILSRPEVDAFAVVGDVLVRW